MLISSDGEKYQMSRSAMNICILLQAYVEEEMYDVEIHLPNVQSKELNHIVNFCEHYIHNPLPIINTLVDNYKSFEDLTSAWCADFFNQFQDKDDLYTLLVAAVYMGIDRLIDTIAIYVALLIHNENSITAICETFNIAHPFGYHKNNK